MTLYSYQLANAKRDLSDVLSTIAAGLPRFIGRFRSNGTTAKHNKHEWLQDQIVGRSLTAVSVSTLTVTASAADVAKLLVGTILTIKDDPVLFRVTVKDSDTTFTVVRVATNGSVTSAPANGSTLLIVSTPIAEASANGDGEQQYRQSETDYNTVQTFRKEIVIPQHTLSTNVYGNVDNAINKHTQDALGQTSRDMNRVALFGRRVQAAAGVRGEIGGIYSFGTGAGALGVDAGGDRFDSFVVNDASQVILDQGGEANLIMCGLGQARVLSNEYKKELMIVRDDQDRGAYVARVVNEINGKAMTIMAEPDIPDSHAWVMDDSGLVLVPLVNDAMRDEDATEKGFHGIKRVAIGSYTLEFRNAKQRLCLITNLQGSVAALAAIKGDAS